MTEHPVLVDRDGDILTLTLSRPDALNALTPPMIEQLIVALTEAEAPGGPSVVVLQGAGRAFSAGVDLKLLGTTVPVAGRVGDVFDEPTTRLNAVIARSGVPLIAKVHGACFTGALELALHCDLLYTTVDTRFGDTHAKFAIRPTWGMSQNLPAAVGMRRARELSYTARTFTGAEAAAWGLANAALPDTDALDAHVADIAGRICKNDRATVAAYKSLHRVAESTFREEGLAREIEADFPEITDTLRRVQGFGR